MARLYPTLILPLQRGGSLPNDIFEKARGINTHGKPGNTLKRALLGDGKLGVFT